MIWNDIWYDICIIYDIIYDILHNIWYKMIYDMVYDKIYQIIYDIIYDMIYNMIYAMINNMIYDMIYDTIYDIIWYHILWRSGNSFWFGHRYHWIPYFDIRPATEIWKFLVLENCHYLQQKMTILEKMKIKSIKTFGLPWSLKASYQRTYCDCGALFILHNVTKTHTRHQTHRLTKYK